MRREINVYGFTTLIILSLIFTLVSNAASLRLDKSILFSRVTIIALAFTGVIAVNNLHIKVLSKGVGIYGGLFNVTCLTQIASTFVILISAIILILTAFYSRKVYVKQHSSLYRILSHRLLYNKDFISNKKSEPFRILEYPLVILFILCGALFLICTADLVSIFLSIELQSYALYIISTIYRDSESSTESGLTYFLLGGLSSSFILLGLCFLYVISGTTSLDNIYVINNIYDTSKDIPWAYINEVYAMQLALIIMATGFLFKVSAAPFHFWSPDVYDGIPTIVTSYVAIIAKVSIFFFLLELMHYTDFLYFRFTWKETLLLSSFFSLIIGSVLGITQSRIKRLLAYSTISHVGFILLALCTNTVESIQAFIFYLLQYTISNLNGFIILVSIGFSFYSYVYNKQEDEEKLTDRNNSPVQLISQLKGYFYINAFLAVSFTITLFSFVGIPPLIGFFAKQMVLSAALDNGYFFMALISILTSVIGASYYLNVIKQIFFFRNDYTASTHMSEINYTAYVKKINDREMDSSSVEKVGFTRKNICLNSAVSTTISVITLFLALFIFSPDQCFNMVNVLSLMLFKA